MYNYKISTAKKYEFKLILTPNVDVNRTTKLIIKDDKLIKCATF